MTTSKLYARWLFFVLVSAALSAPLAGCGDDDDDDDTGAGSGAGTGSAAGAGAGAGTGAGTGGASAGSSGGDPNAAAECPDKVYDALSDGCRACACEADPQLAPSCQKPCWDFLACSFRANAGACAEFAAGGDAMRPQLEACIMDKCGAELAVPGAEIASAYPPIVGACAVPMGDATPPCAGDIGKFISELDP